MCVMSVEYLDVHWHGLCLPVLACAACAAITRVCSSLLEWGSRTRSPLLTTRATVVYLIFHVLYCVHTDVKNCINNSLTSLHIGGAK